ncbi:hypothetical protein V5N11_013659 [Cardamine amara subsp. amara]|uniref:Uncharacterized protein n=1 Tax=Cardamine amara subsp. amara TaxID=228776 RepID=A0ABD1AGN6_CARAN
MDAKRKFSEDKDLCQNDGKRKKDVIPEIQEAGGSSNDINVARKFSNIDLKGLTNIPIMSFNSQENTVKKDLKIESSVNHAVIDGSGGSGSSCKWLASNLSLVVSEFVEVNVKSEEEINKSKDEWKDIFKVNKASKSGRLRKT